ncbi:MAG: AgmX/PglI C-terminal domain-containing protein [Myxococcaceae bacterium]
MRPVKLFVGVALFAAALFFFQLSAQQASLLAGEANRCSNVAAPAFAWRLSPERSPEGTAPEAPEEADAEVFPDLAPLTRPPPAATWRAPVKRRAARPRPPPLPLASRAPALIEPEEALRTALRQNRFALERCYDQELRRQATFDGTVIISLSVTAGGRVVRASVDQAGAREAAVGACIVGRLRALRLPMLSSDAEVTVPIRLRAVGPQA